MTDAPLLSVEGLTTRFRVPRGVLGHRALTAVDGVGFSLWRGQTLGLVGESGCGKTTLGRTILRLIEPDAGSIRFDGVQLIGLPASKLRPLRRRMQVVFQ